MQEEIFGPTLRIVNVSGVGDAIKFINEGEKPLALYIFSNNSKDIKQILDNTSSGGAAVNDVILHIAVESLPFGGVGKSGIGAYHGRQTFDTFVHKKSVLKKNFATIPEKVQALKYPPYSNQKLALMQTAISKKRGVSLSWLPHFFCFLLGILLTIGAYVLWLYIHHEDLERIIDDYHFNRLVRLLKDSKIAIGGHTDPTDRFICPTVVIDVLLGEPLMQEEIFGPILPIVNVSRVGDAIKFMNEGEKSI